MKKLILASTFTLAILFSFVFSAVILVLLYADALSLEFAIGLTILINGLLWILGPWITDHINVWFYKTKYLRQDEFEILHPDIAGLIDEVAGKHNFPFPKIGIIPDQNPTAFTYGSGKFNARIVITEGIFHFLSPEEIKAVVAHELGHIVNQDFIVMMIGSTLVQILYEIYAVLIRTKGRKSDGLKIIAIISFVFYFIGIYLLYFLSRTRETMADEFSASVIPPEHLANGLIKIAYGIVKAEDSDSTKRLLQSTRHLGVIDVKNAKHLGITAYIAHNDPKILAEVMAFDKISPWAKFIELSSTHPLTGKRIDHLNNLQKDLTGREFPFDVDAAIVRLKISQIELNKNFLIGSVVYFAPVTAFVLFFFFAPLSMVPAAVALGLLIQVFYRFPRGEPKETTILQEMRNPYASPISGKQIILNGKVIGRGIPGFELGEDMMFQDKTGLIFLDYNSIFSFIGNWFFAIKKLKTLFDVPAKAEGWFFRGMGSTVALKYIQTDSETVKSHPVFWYLVPPTLLIGLSIYLTLFLG